MKKHNMTMEELDRKLDVTLAEFMFLLERLGLSKTLTSWEAEELDYEIRVWTAYWEEKTFGTN